MPAPISPVPASGPLMQIAIASRNVAALAASCRDVVGLRHLFDAGPDLTFFDLGGVRLMVSVPSSSGLDHAQSLLYSRVTDIEGVPAALETHGVHEEHPPGPTAGMPDRELWISFFRDLDHNLFTLMREQPLPE